jgi:hypothetical protein
MIGFMVNGALFERVGTFAMFGVSGGAALAAAVILVVFRRRGRAAPQK